MCGITKAEQRDPWGDGQERKLERLLMDWGFISWENRGGQ